MSERKEDSEVLDRVRDEFTCIYYPYMTIPPEELKLATLFFDRVFTYSLRPEQLIDVQRNIREHHFDCKEDDDTNPLARLRRRLPGYVRQLRDFHKSTALLQEQGVLSLLQIDFDISEPAIAFIGGGVHIMTQILNASDNPFIALVEEFDKYFPYEDIADVVAEFDNMQTPYGITSYVSIDAPRRWEILEHPALYSQVELLGFCEALNTIPFTQDERYSRLFEALLRGRNVSTTLRHRLRGV